ncbi:MULTISPECIES: LysR family transcriptional regulator [Marinomonas]|uniref:Transcriptional regulator /LysR family transcriptional regulator n=1 Tax=Marinomonas alcarazii TaxID=491949 RepID=A0A318V7G0_9GAMM|nr:MULTISPECIES: LysR family transcriptional regulator [Marinomonas]PYF84626.1 transcriptional regulator /LysR family transcriptional regulator [Marinomonas alcarazii]
MDFNDIYYFYLTAEHGGYTAAERVSGITKSLLSRRVAQLEDKLGIQLIQRNSRRFSLTDAGRQLYEGAINMVAEGQSAYESVALLQSVPSGVVRVSCPVLLAQHHFSVFLPEFMKQYPKVSVYLDVTDRDVQVLEERIDIALRTRGAIVNGAGMVAKKLGTSRMILVASPQFIEEFGMPTHPDQLAKMPTLTEVFGKQESVHQWELLGPNSSICLVQHHPRLVCLNRGLLLSSAVQGVGVGLMPEIVASEDLAAGNLVRVLPDWTTKVSIVQAVYSNRKTMTPALRVFLESLMQYFAEVVSPNPFD